MYVSVSCYSYQRLNEETMSDDKTEKVLGIRVSYDQAIAGIEAYNKKIIALKEEEKKLRQERKEGAITTTEYVKKLGENKEAMILAKEGVKALEKEFKNNIQIQKNLEGSVDRLKAQLSNLTRQYDELGEAERQAAEGKELEESIKSVQEQLKGAENATGRFYRQVGSYEQAIQSAVVSGNGFAGSLLNMANGTGGVVGGLRAMTTAAMKFIATPIGIVLSTIVVVFKAFQAGIKSSEENTAKFNKILAPLKVILDALLNIIQKVVGGILDFVSVSMQAIGKVGGIMASLFGLEDAYQKANDKIKEGIELEKRKLQLSKDTRHAAEDSKKTELEISDLRSKVAQKDKYTHEQRIGFLDEAIKKETVIAEKKAELAKENLAIMEAEAARAGNTAEVEEKLSQARIAVTQATIDLNNKTKEMNAQRVEAINAMKAEEKAARDAEKTKKKEAADRAKEAKEKELEAIRAAEDAILALLKESTGKQRQIINLNYDRQIEDLKKKLASEQNLTEIAKEKINEQINALDQQRLQDLQKVSDEELIKEADKQAKIIELKLSAIKKGTDAELALKLEQIELQKQAELRAAEETGIEKTLIEQKYAAQADELRRQSAETARQKQADEIRLDFENKINEAKLNGENYLLVELEQRRLELEALQQMEDESDAQFKARQLAAQQAYTDSKKAIVNQEIQIEQAKYQAAAQVTGALSGLLESLGEDNKAAAMASKVVALAEIMINTGLAISKMTAAESKKGLIGIATTAAGIASILANMATATKTIKSAKFATGGLVTGSGTGTSDSIPARLSVGESVMTSRTTEMFAPILSMFNQMGGGVPVQAVEASSQQAIGEDMLTRAFTRSIASMPPPVVSVKDIADATSRVNIIDNISAL